MSYKVLYRKYRPKTFDEVLGQDTLINILKNQIINDNISHAYLFTGVRGTGKTSTAKIFAKVICCLNPAQGNPCNECASCKSFNDNTSNDIMEIDAASNRGIDEIRKLKEKVNYLPTEGRKKVYIIDEVHMLTTEAFNALLKTLEEPPSHVVFIFATTEVNRILPTILSRCQRFDFHRIDPDIMVSHMKNILQTQNKEYEEEAIYEIALYSQGALRDALSTLDKAISSTPGQTITKENVFKILGLGNVKDISSLIDSILAKDSNNSIENLDTLLVSGMEINEILNQLIEVLRDKLICISSKNPEKIINKSNEYFTAITQNYSDSSLSTRISSIMVSLSSLKNDIKDMDASRFLLEAKIIKLCYEPETARGENVVSDFDMSEYESSLNILKEEIKLLKKEINILKNTPLVSAPINKEVNPLDRVSNPNIEKKQTPNKVIVNVKDIEGIIPIIKQCATYIRNRYSEHFLCEVIANFKVISYENDTLTVFPKDYVTIMDTFGLLNGQELFKKTLLEKTGKDINVIYLDKDVDVVYKEDSSTKVEKEDLKTLDEKSKTHVKIEDTTKEEIVEGFESGEISLDGFEEIDDSSGDFSDVSSHYTEDSQGYDEDYFNSLVDYDE